MFRPPCLRRAALISLTLLLTCCGDGQCCQRGFLRRNVEALITPHVTKGQVILTVRFHDCGAGRNIWLSTSNDSFEVHRNGSISATRPQNIDTKLKFAVWAMDLDSGETWVVNVLLRTKVVKSSVQVIRFPTRRASLRQKREWITPPIDVREHEPPMHNPIAIIRSDFEDVPGVEITYVVTGPGADEPPIGLFVIDPRTGELNITGTVDREETTSFTITGKAFDQFGRMRENPIDLVIKVLDINDNPPIFTQKIFMGSVEELSSPGTFALRITATDKDIGRNAIISYRIITKTAKQMFSTSLDGEIRVTDPQLDRETQDLYTLLIEARDLSGNVNGMHTTATVEIKILDVNDNIPTMEQTTYEVTVEENTKSVETLRMKVQDKDLEFSDNWLAHFEIIEGNEFEHFRIEVDNRTNEGILIIQKELNFEEMEHIHLAIRLSNKAPYHHTVPKSHIMQPIDIKIIVKDMPEGLVFKPTILVTKIIESTSTTKTTQVIGVYSAVSADTGKPVKMTKYAKDSDVANWLIINSETGEVTFDGILDRESEYVINGTYTATVLAISNERGSPITSTGTILINVEDVNDNIPNFDNLQPCMCSHAKYLNVTASDADGVPFGAPFRFNVQSEQTWKLGPTDATSMQLVPLQDLWPGVFSVPVWIEDNNGKGHTVTLDVTVSDCHGTDHCSSERLVQSKAELGGLAVALMILPLLLLLLLPLLLVFCKCGSGFYGKPGFLPVEGDRTDGTLGQSSIEGGGQVDTMIPLVPHPGRLDVVQPSEEWVGKAGKSFGLVGLSSAYVNGSLDKGARWTVEGSDGTCKTDLMTSLDYGKSAWSHDQYLKWLSTRSTEGIDVFKGAHKTRQYIGQYINQKVHAITQEWTSQSLNDCLLVYNREGSNSPVGSLDCCNLIEESPLDDSFLNDLDPKFRMLAEICSGQSMKEISEVVSSQSWEQKSSPRPLIQQEEVVKKEIVSSSSVMQQHSDFNPLSLKKHYIVTTTIQPSQEEPPFVGDQSGVTSRHEEFQTVSITTDPAMAQKMAVTKVDYGPGGFQGIVPSFTTTPAAQKNVVVVRSGLGGIQSMAADPSTGQGSQMQKTVVVTSSVNTGSEGVQEMLTNQMIGQVPVTHENSVVTGPVNAGLRETLDHSYINKQAIEKNVTTSKSNSGMYKSVKKTTKVVQLVQE